MTRLFLPPLIVSFVTMLLIAAGAWDYPAEVAADRTIIRAETEFHQPRLAGLGAQLMSWGGHGGSDAGLRPLGRILPPI